MTSCVVQVWRLLLAPSASETAHTCTKFTELSLGEPLLDRPAHNPKNSRGAEDILQCALLQLHDRLIMHQGVPMHILGPLVDHAGRAEQLAP